MSKKAKYSAMENKDIEFKVRQIVKEIVLVLRHNGINTISIGGILRILGVPNEVAQMHDEEYMEIVDDDNQIDDIIPPGTTFH